MGRIGRMGHSFAKATAGKRMGRMRGEWGFSIHGSEFRVVGAGCGVRERRRSLAALQGRPLREGSGADARERLKGGVPLSLSYCEKGIELRK